MKQTNMPEIRFDGFEGEWEWDSIDALASVNPSSSLPEVFEYVDLESVVGTTMIGHRTESRHSAPSRAQRLAQYGDIFFQTVRPYQKNNLLFEVPDGDYVFSTGYAQIRPAGDPSFLFSQLQRDSFVNAVLDRCTGTSYPAIAPTSLREMVVTSPPTIEEQQSIGAYFREFDVLLDAESQKLEKLRSLKQTMLTKMFPQGDSRVPEIRFEGFEGEWVPRKLNEIADIVGGGTPSTSVSNYWGGNINWYSPTEIGETVYVSESRKKITPLGFQNSSAKMLPAHTTVLFTSRAGIGNTAILSSPACTNQGFQSFVVRDNHDPYFLYSMTGKIKDLATQHAAGSTFLEISGKQLGQLSLAFPNKPEQQAIGTYFRELDTLLDAESQKLEKLRHLKSAFLSSMFV